MIEFIFDRKTQRYRYKDSGKFVGREAVENLTKKAISQIEKDTGVINDLLVQRKISLKVWEEETRNALRKLHTYQYFLGVGGEKNFTTSDRGSLNNLLKKEWGYLRGFVEDLNNGKLSEAQFRTRINLYINNTDHTYDLARYKAHSRAGYKWERRIRTKTESCQQCIFYEQLGWRALGNLPNPGSECSCRANCGCYKEFSKADFIPNDPQTLLRSWGWVGEANARAIDIDSELWIGGFASRRW